MGRGGFEPPKQFAADLQSVPFGHSGICPYTIYAIVSVIILSIITKADDRTRTDNLLITNQLLCQLSHIGIYIKEGPTKWEDSLISHARFAKQTLMRAFPHCKK